MNYFGLNSLRLPTRLLSFCLLGVAFAAIVFSIDLLISLPAFAFWMLGLAAVAAVFVNQYQLRLPGTRIVVPTASLFAFWGLFWLGPGGAVILGGAALAVGYVGARKELGPGGFAVFSVIV